LAKINPRLPEIAAHGFREDPARLGVANRAYARQLAGLTREAAGEAGDFIAAARDHIGGRDAQPGDQALAHLAVSALVAFVPVRFGQQRADVFEIGLVAVPDLLPHDERDEQALRGLAPVRIVALDLDERLAESRRVVIERRRMW